MSNQEKLEKYKSGQETGLTSEVPKLSDRQQKILDNYKAGRAIIAAGFKSQAEVMAGRTGADVVTKIIDFEPTGPTPGMMRTMAQKYRVLRERKIAEFAKKKAEPTEAE